MFSSMWVFGLFLLVAPPPAAVSNDFLDQASQLREQAWDLKDTQKIRQYTVLVTEFHAQQFLFRAFAMKNLTPGEHLWQLRANTQEVTISEAQGLVESNLEDLLMKAQQKHPTDLNVRFAIAQYLYTGRGKMLSPVLKMPHKEILNVFQTAAKENVYSPTSAYILALQTLGKGQGVQDAMALLKRAHETNPHHPEFLAALGTQTITNGDLDTGGKLSRRLFEMAPTPLFKSEALLNTARVFQRKNNCDQALVAVRASLDLQPRSALAWNIGLDCLREKKIVSDYHAFIQSFLDQDKDDPSLFRIYLDYLKLRKMSDMDRSFISAYETQIVADDISAMTKHANLGNFYLQIEQADKALAAYQQAYSHYKKLDNPPASIEQTLKGLIDLAKNSGSK